MLKIDQKKSLYGNTLHYLVHLEVHCNDYNLPIANAIYIVPVQVVGNN